MYRATYSPYAKTATVRARGCSWRFRHRAHRCFECQGQARNQANHRRHQCACRLSDRLLFLACDDATIALRSSDKRFSIKPDLAGGQSISHRVDSSVIPEDDPPEPLAVIEAHQDAVFALLRSGQLHLGHLDGIDVAAERAKAVLAIDGSDMADRDSGPAACAGLGMARERCFAAEQHDDIIGEQ
jgi:hypothetical protein